MKKTLLFWCPHVGNVGTVKAVLESAKSLSQSKNYKCKILNAFGEFDEHRNFLKNNKIEEIKLIKNRILRKLPSEGFFWSRVNYKIIFRVSGKIQITLFRKFILFISKKKIERVLIQTLESKNRILKNGIYDKKILSLIRDPIIDYNKINL